MICNSHVGRLVRLNFRRTLRGVPFWACLAASWALYAFTCSGLSYNALEGYMRHWDYADTLIFFTTAPWAALFARDVHSGAHISFSLRSGVRAYAAAMALTAALGIALSGLLSHAGILCIAAKQASLEGEMDLANFRPSFLGYLLEQDRPIAYLLAQFVRRLLPCLFFGAMGLWLSAKWPNVALAYMLPIALYYAVLYFFLLFPSVPQEFAPDYLVAPSFYVAQGSWKGIWPVCAYTVPGTLLFLALFCREAGRRVRDV